MLFSIAFNISEIASLLFDKYPPLILDSKLPVAPLLSILYARGLKLTLLKIVPRASRCLPVSPSSEILSK